MTSLPLCVTTQFLRASGSGKIVGAGGDVKDCRVPEANRLSGVARIVSAPWSWIPYHGPNRLRADPHMLGIVEDVQHQRRIRRADQDNLTMAAQYHPSQGPALPLPRR